MSVSVAIRVAFAAKSLSKNKGCLTAIAITILLPIMLIFLIMTIFGSIISSIFNIFNEYDKVPYENAIQAVKQECAIENEFSINSLRCIDIFIDAEDMRENDLKELVETFFIKEVVVENTVKDKNGKDVITTETIIEFVGADDLRIILAKSPFEFSTDDIEMVITMPSFGSTGQFVKPIDNGRLTSPYGYRSDPFTGKSSFHNGMDIVSAQWNAPVYAITDGVVYSVSSSGIGGNMLTIKHETVDGTLYAFYAHLARIDVAPGQEVTTGQTVGLEGGDPKKDPNPGSSTGQHLHFEIRTEAHPTAHTDPAAYIGSF